MNNKKHDRDYLIAATIVIAYQASLTYAVLAGDRRLGLFATVVFGVILYACYTVDRADKERRRLHDKVRDRSARVLEEYERWREGREAD